MNGSGNHNLVRVLWLSCILLLPIFMVHVGAAAPLKKVTLISPFGTPSASMVGLYASEGLGFFTDEGIELSIEYSSGTGEAAALLTAGKADFAITSPDVVMMLVGKGADIISTFTTIQDEINRLVVLKDSPIKQISDLKGKDIGVPALGALSYYTLLRELKLSGMSVDDVKIVSVGFGTAAVETLFQRKVAALMTPSMGGLLYLSKSRGIDINIIPMKGTPIPTNVLATSNMKIQTDRDTVIRVGRAMAKGLVYLVANSTAATDVMAKLHPELVTDRNLIEFNSRFMANASIMKNLEKNPVGWHDPAAWSNTQQLYQDLGLIPKGVDAQKCYTNDLLKEMNDFDRSAIEHLAQPSIKQSETTIWDPRWLALAALGIVVVAISALMIRKRKHKANS